MSGAGADNSGDCSAARCRSCARSIPYLLGFAVIEAGIYTFNGPTGNFTTGFLGLFAIWVFYAWMSPR